MNIENRRIFWEKRLAWLIRLFFLCCICSSKIPFVIWIMNDAFCALYDFCWNCYSLNMKKWIFFTVTEIEDLKVFLLMTALMPNKTMPRKIDFENGISLNKISWEEFIFSNEVKKSVRFIGISGNSSTWK